MNIADKINLILKDYVSGNKTASYKKLKKIFLKNKNNTKLHFNLAVMQHELGLHNEAKSNYTFLANNHSHLKSKINLYNLYFIEENYNESLKIINNILNDDSALDSVKIDKAYALYKLKRRDESIIICKTLIAADSKNFKALNISGLCYLDSKNYVEANKFFLKAFKIDENNIQILNSLGRLNHELRESSKAEKFFLKALKLDVNVFQTLNNIAGFYLEEGKYKKAISYYKQSLKFSKNNSIILNNLAKAYFSLDNIEVAEKYCRKAVSLNNNNDDFKKTISLILLRKLDFKKAWKFFDGRLSLSDFASKNKTMSIVRHKLLTKNNVNNDSRILVIREQGVGDEILYGTMYSDLLKFFNDVKIECDERLIPLFKNSFEKKYRDKFIKLGAFSSSKKNLKDFDYVLYAGSLGRLFRNNLESFSTKPYLKKLENYKDNEFDNIIDKNKKYKVGISWKSFKNRYAKEKSLNLSDLNLILNENNCQFFNLQYGNIQSELDAYINESKNKIFSIKNLDLFNNIVGVVNLLSKLDLLITVSNSTAHLAGALGLKTLLIKPANHASYHYWNYPDMKTPWYNNIIIINKMDLEKENLIQKYI